MLSMATQCKGKVQTKTGRRNFGRCRRMTTHLSYYCPQHRHQMADEYPTLVIGTSIEAARQYAKLLRLNDYILASSPGHVQGIRIRALMCTPAYLNREMSKKDCGDEENFEAYYLALQSFYYYSVPRG